MRVLVEDSIFKQCVFFFRHLVYFFPPARIDLKKKLTRNIEKTHSGLKAYCVNATYSITFVRNKALRPIAHQALQGVNITRHSIVLSVDVPDKKTGKELIKIGPDNKQMTNRCILKKKKKKRKKERNMH